MKHKVKLAGVLISVRGSVIPDEQMSIAGCNELYLLSTFVLILDSCWLLPLMYPVSVRKGYVLMTRGLRDIESV